MRLLSFVVEFDELFVLGLRENKLERKKKKIADEKGHTDHLRS